jgi:hypothetical protein
MSGTRLLSLFHYFALHFLLLANVYHVMRDELSLQF